MSIVFNSGDVELYKGYVGGKAWNDEALLGLQKDTPGNKNLKIWNTEGNAQILLKLAENHTPKGYASSLKTVMSADADAQSLIVLKGIHQPYKRGRQWIPHLSIGMSGYIWHLYYIWQKGNKMSFDGSSKGDWQSPKDHDGFTYV